MGEKFHSRVGVNMGNMARTGVTTSEYGTQATCPSFVGCDTTSCLHSDAQKREGIQGAEMCSNTVCLLSRPAVLGWDLQLCIL